MSHDELMELLVKMFAKEELGLVEVDEEYSPPLGHFLCRTCNEMTSKVSHSSHITEGTHKPGCNLMKLYRETEQWKLVRDLGN
jgi:hypothetical protein